MRFIWTTSLIAFGVSLLCVAPVAAQTAEPDGTAPFSGYVDLITAQKVEPRLQRGRQIGNLKTDVALKHEIYARRLGRISAIDGKDGTLFVADEQSGQIFRLPDRDKNGRTEGARPMPQRFDHPTGLAAADDALYVADRSAVWRINPVGTPDLVAGLTNAKTTGEHFLARGASPDHLWMGINTQDGHAKLLKLSTMTGQAELVEETTGQILDMSHIAGGRPWVLLRQNGKTWVGPSFNLLSHLGHEAGTVSLPKSSNAAQWPLDLSQHITITRKASGDVLAVPIVVTRPLPMGRPLLTGFTSTSLRQQWGQPGPMFQDDRGLFVADVVNGDLWRLHAAPPAPKPEPEIQVLTAPSSESEEVIIAEPKSSFASSIDKASTIDQLSTIERGSLIGRASTLRTRDEMAAEKEAADKLDADKKAKKSK